MVGARFGKANGTVATRAGPAADPVAAPLAVRALGEILSADRTDALGGEADRLPDALVRDADWAAMLVRGSVEAELTAEG
jgi:hypothetical protein